MAHFLLLVGGHAQMTGGELCKKCGAVHETLTKRGQPCCQKHTKRGGKQCGAPSLEGVDACRLHCGGIERARAKGRANIARAAAEAAVHTYGLPRNVDPHVALLEEIARTAGHVDWLANVVTTLNQADIVWGIQSTEKGVGPKGPIDTTVHQAGINVWVDLYQRERRHLVDVCKAAISAGIAERQVQLAEAQGRLIADLLRQIIADPELALDAERQEVARRVAARHLRAIPVASVAVG